MNVCDVYIYMYLVYVLSVLELMMRLSHDLVSLKSCPWSLNGLEKASRQQAHSSTSTAREGY